MVDTSASGTDTTTATGDAAGAAKDAVNGGIGQVKALAKKQPFAFAALAGVLGIALINTLRGKK